jgi:hypothetical protein
MSLTFNVTVLSARLAVKITLIWWPASDDEAVQ